MGLIVMAIIPMIGLEEPTMVMWEPRVADAILEGPTQAVWWSWGGTRSSDTGGLSISVAEKQLCTKKYVSELLNHSLSCPSFQSR